MTIARFELPTVGLAAARVCLAQRLPAGDPERLRAAARRSSALAADLRRGAEVLLASTETGLWRGPAHRAVTEQLRAHTPALRAAADRYDGYAGALAGYAGVVDDTAAALLAVRRQLQQRSDELAGRAQAMPTTDGLWQASQVAGGHSGAGLDPGAELLPLARTFKAGYDRWADGLDRCIRALWCIADNDPIRQLRGFQAFRHRVGHVGAAVLSPFERAVLHPSLHNISACLGELNVGLSVLGLGLLFICPPAGAACLAAATVLAVAQLAVDSTRRAHGEAVPATSLGFELAAAIPLGGNAMRSLRAADEVVHLVPGGGLAAHEAAGGHTLAKHVGKSEAFLRNRLATEPERWAVSTFYDRQVAENSISALIRANKPSVERWLGGQRRQLELSGEAQHGLGIVQRRGMPPTEERGMRVILRKDKATGRGFYIHTAMVTE